MKISKEIIITVAFVSMLLFPAIDSIFHFVPLEKNNENRALKKIPKLDIKKLDLFPGGYDSYYSDNFDLRNQFVRFNSSMKLKVFNRPPVEGKAFFGHDGWMFIEKHQMDTYHGKSLVNDEELFRYNEIFKYRQNFLDSIGCKYYLVIAPTKASVYPEYLPFSKRKNNQKTLTDQIISLMDTVMDFTVVDLRQPLRNAKGGTRLYHKTDNHWNEFGSYIAYDTIIGAISQDFPNIRTNDISLFKIDSTEIPGLALTNMMGIYEGFTENKITCKPNFERVSHSGIKRDYPVMPNFPYLSDYEKVYTTNNDSFPKMLMIRESFAGTIIPFISEHFSESVYIYDSWDHEFNEEIVLSQKPDIYIQLVLEMFIPKIKMKAKKP